ncbi:MAG: methyltransferase [Firmicutes bacterium]|jgi:uroporphyrinogen decarboxylase|nr:methyltransferase [Bacillota bacterium]
MNMYEWLKSMRNFPKKKAMPLLSFPVIQIMGIDVRTLISDSNRQAEGMKIIAERTDAAAAVGFMDLSVEAECFGAEIRFSGNEVPTITGKTISTYEEAQALAIPKIGAGRTGLYIEGIKKATDLIQDRPVFPCVIGSFSLAGRLLGVNEAMIYCYEEPAMVHLVLTKATEFIIAYCQAYKVAGANGVIIAEPLAGLLSPALAAEFSSDYIKQIVEAVQDESFIVIYHNCGATAIKIIDSVLVTGAAAYHFGNAIKMGEILPKIPVDKIVMGNIDPAGQFLTGSPESVRAATLSLLNECGEYPNFIISSGCDLPPLAKWENIEAFFAAVDEYYHFSLPRVQTGF